MTHVPAELLIHLRRARDLADRQYADPLDLGDLAAAAGVSRYHALTRGDRLAVGELSSAWLWKRMGPGRPTGGLVCVSKCGPYDHFC